MSTHKSPHVNKLMNGRTEHHHSGVNKLMHNGKHRAEGGTMGGSSMSGMPMMSSMPYNASHYSEGGEAEKKRRGGKVHRRHRAEGGGLYAINSDRMGVNPVTGKEHPKALRRGGRSCHAEGGTPYADGGEMGTEMYRHGGRAHSRRRHAEGEEVSREHHNFGDLIGGLGNLVGSMIPFKKGGRAHRAEGGEMDQEFRRGGRAHSRRREHHDFGESIGKIAETVLPLLPHLLPMLLKKGGRAHRADGGEMGTEMYRHGGRAHSRRRHHSEGEEVALKRAMGGSGKVRKGMMNEDGSLR